MKFFFYSLVACLLAGNLACKKKDLRQSDDFNFNKSFSISSNFNESSSELLITINLANSLHAYAAGEKIGKPVSLEIAAKNGWEAIGKPDIPAGHKVALAQLGESMVLEGEVLIRQKLKPGVGPGEALLHLQVCTNNACDRPRIHTLPIEAPQK